MFGGFPDLAILLFVPLLFVAGIFGLSEQIETYGPAIGAQTPEPGDSSGSSPGTAAGLTLHERASAGDPPKS